MTATISRLYDNFGTARQVVSDLEAAGLPHKDISLVARNDTYAKPTTHDKDHDGKDDRIEGAEFGGALGTAAGGTAGLLAGLGLLAIPGIGPVVAAGWLVAAAAGAVAGGATGGILGALTQAGVNDDDAHVYAEGVRRGGALVTARVPDDQRGRYESILDRSAVNLTSRRTEYQAKGWSRFDSSMGPYSDDSGAPAYRADPARDRL